MHPWRETSVLTGITIDRKIEKVGANATVIEQRISLSRRTIPAQPRPLLLASNQKRQQLTLRLMHPLRKMCVCFNILKANCALMREQTIYARRNLVISLGAAKINAQRTTMSRNLFDVD
jgi:hypothetical protein